ncbi:MAG: HPr family phosphocarrier protein [Gammaproteobacteria bacterium]|nr:HPr family phosphocarrier protein [Gammaproteobacteria bacterium]
MIRHPITIINKLGLHARAAAKLVSTASQFESRVSVIKDGRAVDGKSIMSVMLLAASCGTAIELEVEGVDEASALDALVTLINNRFDEEQ